MDTPGKAMGSGADTVSRAAAIESANVGGPKYRCRDGIFIGMLRAVPIVEHRTRTLREQDLIMTAQLWPAGARMAINVLADERFLQQINGEPFATVPYSVHLDDIASFDFPASHRPTTSSSLSTSSTSCMGKLPSAEP
jgi:hypothetical protein